MENPNKIWGNALYPLKLDLKMKLTIYLFVLALFQVHGSTYSQSTKITLHIDNVSVENALKQIESLTEFKFLYNTDEGNYIRAKKVSLDVIKKPLSDILKEILMDTPISFEIFDKQIILRLDLSTIQNHSSKQKRLGISPQQLIIGRITDHNGVPLSGANIIEKGTTNGVTADFDGNYSIQVSNVNPVLVISYIGFATKEINVDGKTSLNIILEESAAGLEEVVVVGYGSQKKIEVTGSISSVDGEELNEVKTSDLRNAMQGRLPGVRVKQQSSEPGSFESSIDIRGFGTPLIIVDGVPRENFQKIDPNEIESVSALKDASAAIYGVRAANGVILITTKKGKEGKTKISLNVNTGFDEPAKFADVLNAGQYAEVINEALVNANQKPRYSSDEIAKFYTGNDPAYPSQDWVGALFKKSAPQLSYKLDISGGSDKVQYFLSGSYLDQQGLFRSGDLWYKRYNLRANLTAQITKNLKAEILIGGIHDNKHAPGFGALWYSLRASYLTEPIYSLYANNNPNYLNAIGPNQPIGNVIGDTYEKWKGYESSINDQINTNISMEYKVPFVEGLKLKGLVAYDIISFDNKKFSKPIQTYYYDRANDAYIPANETGKSQVNEEFSKLIKPLQQISLDYNRVFGDHHVTGLILYEQQKTQFKSLSGGRYINLPIDQLTAGNIDLSQTVDSGEYIVSNEGVVGKVGYDYQSKYLLSASFRYDGSSKFAPENRWGFFPALSVGWRLSEEKFIRDNLSFVDEFKIRASYGKVGDDDAANAYQWITGYNYPNGNYFLGGSDPTTGLGFRGATNPYITWYTSTLKNIGFESVFWKGLLSAELDVFKRDRDGLLGYRNLSLPSTIGIGLPEENLNSDITSGFEVVLGTKKRVGEFSYDISANLTYTESKNNYVERAPSNNSFLNWRQNTENRYTDIWWGYKYIGQFQSLEEILRSPIQDNQGNKSIIPGDLKYQDFNGDGIIDDNDIQPIGRGQSSGNNVPPYNFGLNINLTYKHFDCSFLLQGGIGHEFYLGEQWQEPLRSGKNNVYTAEFDRWHLSNIDNPNSEWIPGKFPSTRFGGAINNRIVSDFWLKDGDYVRLKSIEIGYSLPLENTKIKFISSARIYLNGFNILTWTKDQDIRNTIDPESRGDYMWGYNYPINKSYNLGINLTF